MLKPIPKFLKENSTHIYCIDAHSEKDLEAIQTETFSEELEEKLSLIEESVFGMAKDFSNKKDIEFGLSDCIYEVFKKFIIIAHYRTLLYKNVTSKSSLENDLEKLLQAESLKDIESESETLNFYVKQTELGYLTFWFAPENMEFIFSDNSLTYSNDSFSGGKLAHIQELLKTPKTNEINTISKSLDYFPQNYLIIPLNKKVALVLCSPFMKLYTEEYNSSRPPFSLFNLTYSAMTDKRFNEPQKDGLGEINTKIFRKQELQPLEVIYNNKLLLDNAISYIGYNTTKKIKSSIDYYNAMPCNEKDFLIPKTEDPNLIFQGTLLKDRGKFLNYYNLFYENKNGDIKCYEMVSHDGNIKTLADLHNKTPQAVVMVVFNKKHDKILLNKEFRMATGEYIWGSVAGLIEDGEDYETAAKRELKEETGLDLIRILSVLPPSYTATGISNEKTTCIFCEANGEIDVSNEEADEDIKPTWLSKEELQQIFDKKEPFAARTQMFCYMWLNGQNF